MPIKYNQTTLDKIVKALDEAGYELRFEKGTFNSGYCILEHKKVVVVNKFLDLEGRIGTLVDILGLLKVDPNTLSAESKKIYEQVLKEFAEKEIPEQEQQTEKNDQEES